MKAPAPTDAYSMLLLVFVIAAMAYLAECASNDWTPRAAPGSPLETGP